MKPNDLNHGQLLKDWSHYLQLKPKTLLERLEFDAYESLYYYYGRKEIKISQLQKWADAFQITLEQLLAGPGEYRSAKQELEESQVPYRLHHGKRIKQLVEERHTKITQLAATLNYTRQNIYDMFDRPTIDVNILKDMAKFFNVPLTYFTGGGPTKGTFEQNQNEVLQQFEVMLNRKMAETLAAIELLFKKYKVQSK